MGDTAIEWTDKTWNPTTGCDRVSPGCDHCYAMTLAKRLKGMGSAKYQRDGDPQTSGPGFGITEHSDELLKPLSWTKPAKVFVNSMSDLFHQGVSSDFIVRVLAVIAMTPQHTYQILTKRHARMRNVMSQPSTEQLVRAFLMANAYGAPETCTWPLPNVWLGVSVEDQKWADIRIPALLDTPAAVRFLSCEPLLGQVELRPEWLAPAVSSCSAGPADVASLSVIARAAVRYDAQRNGVASPGFVDWVIVGGESGPGARPMHPDWARSLRDQCVAAGVPFLLKQWGEWLPLRGHREHLDLPPAKSNREWSRPFGDDVTMCRVGKKAAGRELDGRTWDQFPAVSS